MKKLLTIILCCIAILGVGLIMAPIVAAPGSHHLSMASAVTHPDGECLASATTMPGELKGSLMMRQTDKGISVKAEAIGTSPAVKLGATYIDGKSKPAAFAKGDDLAITGTTLSIKLHEPVIFSEIMRSGELIAAETGFDHGHGGLVYAKEGEFTAMKTKAAGAVCYAMTSHYYGSQIRI